VALLHKYAGPDYLQKIIIPQVVSIVRELVAQYSSKTVYTKGLQEVVTDIAITADSIIIDELSPPGFSNIRLIRINAVQLASITFPPEIRKAILNKMSEQQNAEAMTFKIEAASLEAERKVIEATGIKQFQDIAFKGEIESYLRYRGIEATESLAKSDNAKVMLFGSGSSGLPLVLGDINAKQSSILK
jgi:regulator of protease activity HflC (stomatin/prohibitin superfamily)